MTNTAHILFKDVVHSKDAKGVLCNSTIAREFSDEEGKVTCNKCNKFLEHPKALEIARNHRESEEYEKAAQRAIELREKKIARRNRLV